MIGLYHPILADRSLSYKAKGIYFQMLSMPSKEDLSIKKLSGLSKDGTESVRSALAELEKAGYLNRTQVRENGMIVGVKYAVADCPPHLNDITEREIDGTSF